MKALYVIIWNINLENRNDDLKPIYRTIHNRDT